ncbi:programmed cell death 2 C-terminal domain-containing protein [Tasmannia lanceolata]|uniref:programmed cell death 2 C-terminal domain-containing protein n=1 Tax=Tasmannia lanceolata TaxID=3420 RepID=UPI004063959A
MTRITLGMPGLWAVDNYEASDYYTTKIGGLPDWPILETDISPGLLQCGVCGKRLCLVAQVYAPVVIDGLKVEERTIYVLGCLMPKCGSSPLSWRTLRVQNSYNDLDLSSVGKEVVPLEPSCDSVSRINNCEEDDLWRRGFGEKDADDGSDGDLDLVELGKALQEAASLVSSSKKQKGRKHTKAFAKYLPVKPIIRVKDARIPVIPCFYIYSQEEPSFSDVTAISANYSSLSIKESRMHLDDHEGEETWEGEGYEYDKALDADRTYLKFKKRMDACPEQCFRYSFGGKPLLDKPGCEEPKTCGLCGEPQRFEIQLMPPLLYFLQQAADSSLERSLEDWNWMTLIVYTCSKSCSVPPHENNNGWTVAEEVTIIQYENLLQDSTRIAYFS